MTNDYKIILPLMISCVIATLLTTKLQKESIYTLKLIRRGIDLFRGREINILRSLPVKNIMNSNPEIIPANTTFDKLMNLLVDSTHSDFFVVDDENRLQGSVSVSDVRQALAHQEYLSELLIAQDLVNHNQAQLKPDDTLDHAMKTFGQFGMEELPVVDSDDPEKIIGSVQYRDLIKAYNRELIKRDMVQELSSSIKLLEKQQKIPFLQGHAMAEIPVPLSFAGKTVKQLQIRARFGVNVLMIKRKQANNEIEIIPRPEEIIRPGDLLIAMGREKDLSVLRNL
jgi:CIC family chloride channel protein